VKYLFHGYLVDAKRLTVKDKEGVDWDSDTGSIDGAFWIRTTIGKENFVPGNFLVSTLDGASVRVRTAEEFLPFAILQEETIEKPTSSETAPTEHRSSDGSGVFREGNAGNVHGGVRVADAKAEAVGDVKNSRRRSAAQRRSGNLRRDEGAARSKLKAARKAHARYRNGSTGRRGVDPA
jgi:hypothetical protein